MDSASACLVSVFGLFVFFDGYGLDWTLLSGSCHFLCLSLPPVSLLDSRLHPLIQICCLDFVLSTSTPKFNYFDYTTYLDLVIKVEQDLLFMVMSWFAPTPGGSLEVVGLQTNYTLTWILKCHRWLSIPSWWVVSICHPLL